MFYLIDNFGNKVSSSYIELDFPINGFRAVEIPAYVPIDEKEVVTDKFTYQDILKQKYEGILAAHPQFDNIEYDDLSDPSSFDVDDPRTKASYGKHTFWLPENGWLQTEVIDIGSDLYTKLSLYWETYTLTRVEKGFRTEVYYEDIDNDALTVHLSNDNGTTWKEVSFMDETLFPVSHNKVIIRFENSTSNRLYLGSLAILY